MTAAIALVDAEPASAPAAGLDCGAADVAAAVGSGSAAESLRAAAFAELPDCAVAVPAASGAALSARNSDAAWNGDSADSVVGLFASSPAAMGASGTASAADVRCSMTARGLSLWRTSKRVSKSSTILRHNSEGTAMAVHLGGPMRWFIVCAALAAAGAAAPEARAAHDRPLCAAARASAEVQRRPHVDGHGVCSRVGLLRLKAVRAVRKAASLQQSPLRQCKRCCGDYLQVPDGCMSEPAVADAKLKVTEPGYV